MKPIALVLLALLSTPVLAQSDPCGGASLDKMAAAPAEPDPVMQKKMDRLLGSMRVSYEKCMAVLARRDQHDNALGIVSRGAPATDASTPVTTPSPASDGKKGIIAGVLATTATIPDMPGATRTGAAPMAPSCSVVDATGKPCIRKASEAKGVPGNSDQATYENVCGNAIEVSAIFKDGSHGAATVKPGKLATLLCSECGGVVSIETACK